MNLPLPIVIAGGALVLVTLVVFATLFAPRGPNTATGNPVPLTPSGPTPTLVPSPPPQPEPTSTPARVPPKPSSQKLSPTAPEKLSADQLAAKFGGAMVWLGAEIEGNKLPRNSGWAITPTKVVTTAFCVAELRDAHAEGHRVFVVHGEANPQFITVTQFRTHPRYREKRRRCHPGNSIAGTLRVDAIGSIAEADRRSRSEGARLSRPDPEEQIQSI